MRHIAVILSVHVFEGFEVLGFEHDREEWVHFTLVVKLEVGDLKLTLGVQLSVNYFWLDPLEVDGKEFFLLGDDGEVDLLNLWQS